MGIGINIQVLDTDPVIAYCYRCNKDQTHLLVDGWVPQEATCDGCGYDYITKGYISLEFDQMDMGIWYSTWSDIIDYIGGDFHNAANSALGPDDCPHYSHMAGKPEEMLQCISKVPGINEMIKEYRSDDCDLDRIPSYVVKLHFMCIEAMRMSRIITGA